MSQLNLYVHYDSVTNHIMTRGIDLQLGDFDERFFPENLILAEAPKDFGRYDSQTNFKILRGANEVRDYMEMTQREKIRMSNWIDFESIESMHALTPLEISELLYLFHANRSLRSAFFYKLQNNYVYLTLPNGLNKMFYRHVVHFYPRFQRSVASQMSRLMGEHRTFFRRRTVPVGLMSQELIEDMAPLFANGLKINFEQSFQEGANWHIPLNIIEDQLTLLTLSQRPVEHIGYLIYNTETSIWQLNLNLESNDEFGGVNP
ncbi:hypothetical protein [Suicoccus acidiformans]|uniref:hypothetical protein n=1 Tax=Suicoccus acidiformans TaxID=2036206 RepID=UPI0019693C74|nr:hypothetical protein [Suicoccus acidiformans]